MNRQLPLQPRLMGGASLWNRSRDGDPGPELRMPPAVAGAGSNLIPMLIISGQEGAICCVADPSGKWV